MTTFKATFKSAFARLDGAIQHDKEKNTKITASFTRSPLRTTTFGFLAVIFVFFSLAGAASANEPWWHITSGSEPTNLKPGSEAEVVVTAQNLGNGDANGNYKASLNPSTGVIQSWRSSISCATCA